MEPKFFFLLIFTDFNYFFDYRCYELFGHGSLKHCWLNLIWNLKVYFGFHLQFSSGKSLLILESVLSKAVIWQKFPTNNCRKHGQEMLPYDFLTAIQQTLLTDSHWKFILHCFRQPSHQNMSHHNSNRNIDRWFFNG